MAPTIDLQPRTRRGSPEGTPELRRPPPDPAALDPRRPVGALSPADVLRLQAAAGNRAVARMIQRDCGCGGGCCSEEGGGEPAEAARPQVEALAASAAASTSAEELTALADRMEAAMNEAPPELSAAPGGVAPLARVALGDLPQREAERTSGQRGGLGAFCTPYAWWELPQAARDKAFLIATLPGVSSAMFGTTEVGAIWLQFLMGGSPTRRSYATAGNPIVEGFAKASVTAADHGLALDEVEDAVRRAEPAVTGAETRIEVSALGVTPDRSINWSNPYDIPGHLAGGQSGGAGGADTRTLRGGVFLRRVTMPDGTHQLVMRSDIEYYVNDTVDFCPGGAGSGLEQALTVPLSRLEATGTTWASDVPFDVTFKPPSVTRVLGSGAPAPDTDAGRSWHELPERAGDRSRDREDGVRREDQDTRRVD